MSNAQIENKIAEKPATLATSDVKEASDGFKRFMKATSPDKDPVTMVLRCHLLAEYYLDRTIVASLPRGDIIIDNESRFMFMDKLAVVESLDNITKDVIDSLKKLNKVRNSCTHEQDYEILEGDIDKIGMPFGAKYLKAKQNCKDKKEQLYQALMFVLAHLEGQVRALIEK
jgi:hypothetical protein